MKNIVVLVLCVISIIVLAGCTAPVEIEAMESTESSETTPIPSKISFTAPTLDRAEDLGSQHDLRNSFDGPILMLWVASGCSGCHDWTDLIRNEMNAGNISNTTTIVSVHRYPEFETTEDMERRYGDNTSEHYAPWPVLVPDASTTVIDRETGRMTDVGLYAAFGEPVTPTLQVIDSEGGIAWTSSKYWANTTVLEEALNIMAQQDGIQ
ncbi:MAG: hypothetical protein P8Q40_07620 [Candidatus Poseidonia sp.]|uniref:hypothetical protein n=1 Tax=Poseidonia sp. TaxID=2666344 RepID=UPI0030BE7A31|nr:hypothetical protein [Poseidonia sp.]